jgi:ABC-2 type transport system permease protein
MSAWLLVFVVVYLVQQVNLFASVRVYDSITSEAENHTLEILITSVTPMQFVVGKLSGLMLAGLTQLGIWAGTVLFLAWSSSRILGVSFFANIWGWEHLGLLVSVLLAAHVLNQILAAAFGLLRMSGGLGAQLLSAFGLITTLGMFYILYVIPPNPNTPLAIGLSLFPLTMPIALPVRAVVATVPHWQVILAQVLMWLTNILALLWVRYLVRANLMKYSAAFSLREWVMDWLRQRRWWPGRKRPQSSV